MNKSVKRIFDYLGSRRFAIILLVITTSVILVGNLLPSPVLMSREEVQTLARTKPLLYVASKTFHVMNLTKTQFFLIIPAFIFLSVTICTYRRAKGKLREKEGAIPPLEQLKVFKSCDVRETGEITAELVEMGWDVSVVERGDNRIVYGRKGDRGILGSILFHIGIDLLLIGAVVSVFTRYNGRLMLTEGFEVEPEKVLAEMKMDVDTDFPYKKMLLESFETVYREGSFPVDHTAIVGLVDRSNDINRETIKVNQPLKTGGYQLSLDRSSFSPRFIVTERNGKEVVDAYVNLVLPGIDKSDYFDLPGTGIRIDATFFPDFFMEGNRPGSRSVIPNNPVFLLEFYRAGEKVGSGLLPLNKRMDFDDGRYTIQFADLKTWILLSVSRDSGLPLVAAALFIIVLGLVVRFMLNEKRVWVVINKEGSYMGGRAGYFPALYEEELKRLSEKLGFSEGEAGVESK